MRIHTVHVRAGEEPVLVREGFSVGALLLPTIWFLWNRMVLVAGLHIIGLAALALLVPAQAAGWVIAAAEILVAMHAYDLRRWTLSRRGYRLTTVVVARNEEEAFLRLAARQPAVFGPPSFGTAA